MSEREPAWLTHKVDQRVAQMKEGLGAAGKSIDANLVMTTLTEPPERASQWDIDQWERSCDNCGVYCQPYSEFYTGSVTRSLHGTQVIVTFGICPRCKP